MNEDSIRIRIPVHCRARSDAGDFLQLSIAKRHSDFIRKDPEQR